MELNFKGCEALAIAIYEQAAKDYIEALIKNDKGQLRSIKKFLLSDAYDIKAEVGQNLIDTCKKETNCAVKTIDSFLQSDFNSIELNEEKISIKVLRHIVSVFYQKKLFVDYKKGSYFLRKK